MSDIAAMGATRGDDGRLRCPWAGTTADYQAYHDDEWGRPVVDDVRLYEKLCLEGFQSGLSWLTILRKREAFRRAFAGFEPEKVAAFDDGDVTRLLGDAGIVRHRGKIEAAIANAAATLAVRADRGSLAALVWEFEPARRGRAVPVRLGDLPPQTAESVALSKALAPLRVPVHRADDRLRRHAVARAGQRPPEGLPRADGLRAGTASTSVEPESPGLVTNGHIYPGRDRRIVGHMAEKTWNAFEHIGSIIDAVFGPDDDSPVPTARTMVADLDLTICTDCGTNMPAATFHLCGPCHWKAIDEAL